MIKALGGIVGFWIQGFRARHGRIQNRRQFHVDTRNLTLSPKPRKKLLRSAVGAILSLGFPSGPLGLGGLGLKS